MLKAFCDGCGTELGVVGQAQRQGSRERGHHRDAKVPVDGGLVLDVQLHVVPQEGQHVCGSCAKRALERAWRDAPPESEGVPADDEGQEAAGA